MPLRRASTGCRRSPMGERGQGTVEFAVVTAAFMAIVVAFGALWGALGSGLFVDHALASASHRLVASDEAAQDVLRY